MTKALNQSLPAKGHLPVEKKLSHMRFEPSGWTGNPKIGYAKSFCFAPQLRPRSKQKE